eukprot:12982-Heterococcus_DN1.PRE.2
MPVEEYGAALLRGMGWSGPDITSNSDNPSDGTLGMAEPRHHRLGLGAQPKPPEPTHTNGFGNGKKYIPKPGDQPRRAEEELKLTQTDTACKQPSCLSNWAVPIVKLRTDFPYVLRVECADVQAQWQAKAAAAKANGSSSSRIAVGDVITLQSTGQRALVTLTQGVSSSAVYCFYSDSITAVTSSSSSSSNWHTLYAVLCLAMPCYAMLCYAVPGLGKVSVRIEAGGAEVNVSRTDAAVVPEDELAMKPFNIQRSATAETLTKSSSSSRADKHKGEYSSDGSRSDSERRNEAKRAGKKDLKKDSKKDKKRDKQRDSSSTSRDDKYSSKKSGASSSSSRKRSRSVEKEERHHRSQRSSERDDRHVDKKQHKSGESHTHKSSGSSSGSSSSRTWLCSSIRVRVVGRAYKSGDSARHYCKKGTVTAVQSGSSSSRSSIAAVATVRMDSGDVLQSVLQVSVFGFMHVIAPCAQEIMPLLRAIADQRLLLGVAHACLLYRHSTADDLETVVPSTGGAVKVLRGSSYGISNIGLSTLALSPCCHVQKQTLTQSDACLCTICYYCDAAITEASLWLRAVPHVMAQVQYTQHTHNNSSCAVLQRMCLPALLYPNTMLDLQHVQRMMLTLYSSLHARAARASNICTHSSSQHKLAEGMASVQLNDTGSTLLTLSLDDIAEVV